MTERRPAIVLTPRLPWPLDDGGRIGLWQTVESIAGEWPTVLLTMVPHGEPERPVPRPVVEAGIEIIRVPHQAPPLLIAALAGAFDPMPVTLARYRNPRFSAALRDLVRRRNPEFTLLNHLHLGVYADDAAGTPTVLREHNVEYLWLKRLAESTANPLVRAFVRRQARKMFDFERRCCEQVDLVLGVQPHETELLRHMAPGACVETVPIGVDFGRFEPRRVEDPPAVLLLASFGWAPNAEGARRFLREVWPVVKARVPSANLRLVGKDLPRDLAASGGREGIQAIGYVERSEAELARAALLVVPLWVGAGARVKIVEALAARTPVVSTSLGAEGLGLTPGTHLLCEDSPAGLAESVVLLLQDPGRAARLAEAGHALAVGAFSLQAVGARMNRLCQAAIDAHANRARNALRHAATGGAPV